MNRELPFTNIFTIGLMLFALFFGAGNLVFPAMMGQYAGDQYLLANLGFLLTGVGLPLLAIMAFVFSGSKDLLALTSRVHPWFAVSYTTLLYLSIGPLFAMPRAGSVAFEIGLKPFIPIELEPLWLALFSIAFFGMSLVFSLNPAKLIDIVGKVLTPVLVVFIGFLVFAAIKSPLGEPQTPIQEYMSRSFFRGFQEGYLTMDALAAFVFAIVVIESIRDQGVVENRSVLRVCVKAAIISAIFLSAIYTSLTYLGATSVAAFGRLENGGEVLHQSTQHFFGSFGGIVLGIIVTLACLTTSIGLTASCGSYFHKLFPGISYRNVCIILSVVSALLANVGLTALIQFSVPVLTILYPMAIALIFLTFSRRLFQSKRSVFIVSMLLTFIVSLVDGLKKTPLHIERLHDWFSDALPLYDLGLGWLIPAIAGALLGFLLSSRSVEANAGDRGN